MMASNDRYFITRRVTLIGAVLNVVLAIGKIVFGWLGQSQALIADGLHSFSDLISDGMVVVAAKLGNQQADDEHPYGHGRIETLASLGMGLLLILVGVGIVWDGIHRLLEPEHLLQPGWLALSVAFVSILAKEALYHYTVFAAKQINSNLLKANAWHHRSDAVSSVVVLVGVAGSMAGLPWLDAVGAIVVAFMVGHVGWELGWQGAQELIDTAVEPEKLQEIETVINNVYGVRALHQLRTRQMNGEILVDVHVQVDPRLSVSEGHQISEAVQYGLLKQHNDVSDVIVHIDPEDDEENAPNAKLPMRDVVLAELQQCWQHIPCVQHVEHINLHYLSGSISVDIHMPLSTVSDAQHAQDQAQIFEQAIQTIHYIKSIRVYYQA